MNSLTLRTLAISAASLAFLAIPAGVALAAIGFGTGATWVQTNTATNANVVIAKPAGTVSGDVLVAGVTVYGGSNTTISTPSGWTLISRTNTGGTGTGSIGMASFYKVTGGSEPANYTWNITWDVGVSNGNRSALGGITRYTGVDNTTPLDVGVATLTGNSTSAIAPSVTTITANTQVINLYAAGDNVNFTPASGSTERYDTNIDVNGGATGDIAGALHDFTKASAGSTGTKTATFPGSANWVAQTVALKVAPTTGTIIVKKTMVGGTGTFNFTGNPSGSISANNGTISATVASGTYTSTETLVSGWDLSSVSCDDNDSGGSVPNHNAVFHLAAGETVTCTFTNTKLGTISGMKFEDLNGNGVKDTGEPGLGGWTITLKKGSQVASTTETLQDGSYSFLGVSADTYTVEETPQTGWTQTTANPAPIVVAPGGAVTGIDFGNFHEVTITGLKWDDTNGDGIRQDGEPGQPGVDVEIRRVLPGHYPVQNIAIDTEMVQLSLTGTNGVFTGTVPTPGNYVAIERVPTGSQPTYPVDSFFDIFVDLSGQTIDHGTVHSCQPTQTSTCQPVPIQFGNFKLVTVTVQKDVVSPSGGAATDPHVFKATLDGGAEQTFSEIAFLDFEGVGPGSHTVREIGDPDFDLLSIKVGSIVDPTPANGAETFSVESGKDVTIVVTNKQKLGHLTITKNVQNHTIGDVAIGTADANDFSFSLNGGSATFFSADEGAMTGQNTVDVDPGAYTVTESGPEYAGSFSDSQQGACAGIVVGSNKTETCTINNSDIVPLADGAITVIKHVVNDNGGSAEAGGFALWVASSTNPEYHAPASNGVAMSLVPDTYTVSENETSGYTKTTTVCTNGETETHDGTVSLHAQEAWVCTITNDDLPGTLHVVKNLINNNGGTASASDFSFKINNGTTTPFEANGHNDISVDAGTYSVTETATSTYATTYSETGCTNVHIANGGEATCTITNDDKPAHLTIVKKTDSGSGDSSFHFTINGTNGTEFSTSRDVSTIESPDHTATSSDIEIPAGTLDVLEDIPDGWHLADVSCVYDTHSTGQSITRGERITVGNGDNVTCTFTDTKQGTLIVKKVVVNDNGGTASASDFSFKINSATSTPFEADGQNNIVVASSTYSVTEAPADGYTTTYDNCTDVSIAAGETKTCTITNNDNVPAPTTTPPPTTPPVVNNGAISPIFFGGGSVLGVSTTTGQVLGATAFKFTKNLRYRMHDSDVKELQKYLVAHGYSIPHAVTDYFGTETLAAVKAFQKANGLPSTGFVGPLTRAILNAGI